MPMASLPNGIDLYHEVHGDGEPVLLLMGTGADHSGSSAGFPCSSASNSGSDSSTRMGTTAMARRLFAATSESAGAASGCETRSNRQV